jgi:hypothetical protein
MDVVWPPLPYAEWRETRDTLHMYTQVVGKLRLALSPFEPQWANVPLYLTARGLTTSPMPGGRRSLDAEIDLLGHELVLRTTDGMVERRPLGGSVAEFHADVMRMLDRMSIAATISAVPVEVDHPIPFADDHTHDVYEPQHASRFFQVLSMVDLALKEYHACFRGRTTPVQFFWGSFDLAVCRHSTTRVAPSPQARGWARYTYDAEAICSGWWPGDEHSRYPAFYAYAHPSPTGLEHAAIEPAAAAWNTQLDEIILPYDAVRQAADPRQEILTFLRSAYDAAASLMRWDAELTHIDAPPR